jgi:glycosyltransferase involved in cell wall biosynthesis
MTYKISFNTRHIEGPYGGGNQFASALQAYLEAHGHRVYRELVPGLDAILILTAKYSPQTMTYAPAKIADYLQTSPNTVVLHRINTCDEPRGANLGDNEAILAANQFADYTVFVSDFVKRVFIKHGYAANKPHGVILNASDPAIFNPEGRVKWHSGEKMRIVTHHWSTNYMKGFDIYERLDLLLAQSPYREMFEFTYIGNRSISVDFKHVRVVPPLQGHELAAALKKQHLYLTAARHEPGGNHYIEAVQCGLPVLYLQSGSLDEYCGDFGLGFNLVNFEEKLHAIHAQYAELYDRATAAPHTSDRMGAAYLTVLNQLIEERRHHPRVASMSETGQFLQKLQHLPGIAVQRLKKAARVLRYG